MSREPYMELVVQVVMFLELSEANTVDEDAAVALMEQIAATLQQLDADGRRELIQYCAERARASVSPEERRLLEDLPEALGLTP